MKKQTKTYIIIFVFILALACSILYFAPRKQTSGLNTGGGVYFDVNMPKTLFDTDTTSTITIPYTMKIYFGMGWDRICFETATVYWVENEDGDVMGGDAILKTVVVHDSDQRNKPYTTSHTMSIPISNYEEGEYTLFMKNFITDLNDIRNAECRSIPNWNSIIASANERANVKEEPTEWMQVLIDSSYMLKEGNYKTGFVIGGKPATCTGVSCEDYCEGRNLKTNGHCLEGTCHYETVIDSEECGNGLPDIPMPVIISVGVAILFIILIILSRNNKSKKTKRKSR